MDNDGEITPEELVQILTSVGESPGDLNMYFSGMSDGTITDYRAVVDWLTFCIKHGKFRVFDNFSPTVCFSELEKSGDSRGGINFWVGSLWQKRRYLDFGRQLIRLDRVLLPRVDNRPGKGFYHSVIRFSKTS